MDGQGCEQLTLFQEGSPVSHTASRENVPAKKTKDIYGLNTSGLYEKLGQEPLWLKMCLGYYTRFMTPFAPTWKRQDTKVWTLCVPAYAVGAHHERYRVAVIAIYQGEPGLQAYTSTDPTGALRKAREYTGVWNWDNLPGTYWAVHKPPFFGMAHGIPGGVDGRVKFKSQVTALGNAVVPQQFYPIFLAIKALEEGFLEG